MKLLDEYRASLKMREVEEFFDLYFYRPLAFAFVKGIYRTNITPNQITVISMMLGVVAGVLFGLGSTTTVFAAGIFLILYDVLDCSDGQLARLKKNGTRTGRILDGAADYIVNTIVYLGIGIGFAAQMDNPVLWWLLLAFAGASNTAQAILVDYYRNRFLDIVLQRVSTFEEDLQSFDEERREMKRQGGHYFDRLIIDVYLRYSRVQRRLTSGQKEHSALVDTNPDLYYSRNRLIMQLWLLVGPTTQITFLVVCAFLNRLDIYIIGIATVWNLWAGTLYFLQNRINLQLASAEAS
ncbi:MAG: CDP-alcohol phosphatidyltransferase family protein [Bacteroidetes bacterium]|nr:CDP-alcohol phosphatidyltransferase family protein [Bacteroidota bacterium]